MACRGERRLRDANSCRDGDNELKVNESPVLVATSVELPANWR